MKILQVLPALEQGGVERGTLEIASALTAAGIPNAVASAGGRLVHALDDLGVEHLALPLDRKNPFTLRKCAKKLAEYCKAEDVTLMHVRSRAPAWAVKWASERCGVKWMATFHGVYGTSPKFLKVPYNRVMLKGERTIAVSNYVRQHILATYDGVDPEKVVLVHRGADTGVFRPDAVPKDVAEAKKTQQYGFEKDCPVITLPGRLTRWKGQEIFIEALSLMRNHRYGVLVLGSDQGRTDYSDHLRTMAGKLPDETRVVFRSHTSEIPVVYAMSDIVVNASSAQPEAFGGDGREARRDARDVGRGQGQDVRCRRRFRPRRFLDGEDVRKDACNLSRTSRGGEMKKSPRILFVGNFLIRHWGNGRSGIDMRLAAGAIRNGWQVLTFSERDIARFLAPLGFMRSIGAKMMNDRLLKTVRNWRPDFVFVAHCDYITNETLFAMREAAPGVRIVHINCDPVETEHCCAQIRRRMDSCDAIFVTTAGDKLKEWTTGKNVVGFYPNPSDPSFEVEDNSLKTEFEYDLFFAGRPADADQRKALLEGLLPKIDPKVRLGFFGMGRPLVVGRAYEEALAASKMGLSINRFEGWKWYASDRITHLMANGILTFQYDGNSMQDFFTKDETVYFHAPGDLAERISWYNTHDETRRVIAAAGMRKYRRLFDARRVVRYLVETAAGESHSEPYEWAKEVYS